MTILRLSLLGEPCLTTSGGRVLARPGPKGLALLACLATAPDLRMGRATLADLLWSDAPSTSAARHALRQCLVRLRAQLGDAAGVLVADDDSVWLDPDLVSLDIIDARTALQSGACDAIAALSRTIGGRFCAGLDLGLAGFEAWLRDRQREYDQLCADLHGMAAATLAEDGDGAAAIAAARRRLAVEPFQDDAHAALIALCIGFGRRQEAAAAHAACHDLFRRELGAAPASQVDEALRTAARAHHAALPLRLRPAPDARRPVFGAFAAGLAAAAALFQLLGPWSGDQASEPARNQMSIWVSAAEAGSAQAATFPDPAANPPKERANDQSQTAMRRMLEGDTDYAMLYPAGC